MLVRALSTSAAGLGIGPRLRDPKSPVLPLNDPAILLIDN